MKIKGAELAAFERDAFPKGYVWDHELFGEEPDPDAVYDTDEIEGPYWDGNRSDLPDGQDHFLDLDTLIEAWRATLSHDVVTVRVPRAPDAVVDPADLKVAVSLLLASEEAIAEIAKMISAHKNADPVMVAKLGLAYAAEPSGQNVPQELTDAVTEIGEDEPRP